jgi:hypothetical protein
VPELSHLWQRFVLASALVFGLALGVGATVFAYSNTTPVTLGWSVFHLGRVPLWTVVLAPLALVLVAGTLFHWLNSLHHFTEHMRHRHRVHELEAEVRSLKARLDSALEMPDHTVEIKEGKESKTEPAPVVPEPVLSNGEEKAAKKTKPVAVAAAPTKETETESETKPEPPAEA